MSCERPFPLVKGRPSRVVSRSRYSICAGVTRTRAARPSPDPILLGMDASHTSGRERPRIEMACSFALARTVGDVRVAALKSKSASRGSRAPPRARSRLPRPRRGPRDARRGRHARTFPEGCRHRRRSHRDQLACDSARAVDWPSTPAAPAAPAKKFAVPALAFAAAVAAMAPRAPPPPRPPRWRPSTRPTPPGSSYPPVRPRTRDRRASATGIELDAVLAPKRRADAVLPGMGSRFEMRVIRTRMTRMFTKTPETERDENAGD